MSTLLPATVPRAHSMWSPSLCELFQRLSLWTWDTLATAASVGMPRSEESITEHLLLELATHCPLRIQVVPFTKSRESRVGADWEWWFWKWPVGIGCRVQAKKINFRTWNFDSLKFRPHGRAQINTLITAAATDGLIPLYCFYSFESSRFRSPGIFESHLQGCTLARAEAVAVIRSKAGLRLIPRARPWHDAVCDGSGGTRELPSLGAWLTDLTGLESLDSETVRELPAYVRNLVVQKKFDPSLVKHTGSRDQLNRSYPVRGIVTIRVGN